MKQQLECTNPTIVNDEDYMATLDNNGRAEFVQHLNTCSYCQIELKNYTELDQKMHYNFGFISSPLRLFCGEAQQIGDYIMGLLSPVETRKMQQHLSNCEYCAFELQSIRPWFYDGEGQLGEVQQAENEKPFIKEKVEWLRRVVATMLSVGESQNGPSYAMMGVRGSDEGLPTTFQAEEVSVTVTVQPLAPNSKELMVLGLVQRENYSLEATAGLEVRLLQAGTTFATETVDELGNFVFVDVKPLARFDLEIAMADKIVCVPNLGLN